MEIPEKGGKLFWPPIWFKLWSSCCFRALAFSQLISINTKSFKFYASKIRKNAFVLYILNAWAVYENVLTKFKKVFLMKQQKYLWFGSLIAVVSTNVIKLKLFLTFSSDFFKKERSLNWSLLFICWHYIFARFWYENFSVTML